MIWKKTMKKKSNKILWKNIGGNTQCKQKEGGNRVSKGASPINDDKMICNKGFLQEPVNPVERHGQPNVSFCNQLCCCVQDSPPSGGAQSLTRVARMKSALLPLDRNEVARAEQKDSQHNTG